MPRSPLHPYHQEIGARFVDFGGWEMPIRYTSVLAEHRAVRESTGWFDVSHLGRFSWSGEGAGPALSRLLCNDHERIGPGRAQYTLMLNPRGGVIDDLIIWKLGSGEVMVMPNGVNHLRVMDGFRAAAPDARLLDLRPGTAALAVQGPDSPARVKGLLGEVPGHFGVIRVDYGGREVWVAGTGYTGERGVELVTDPQTAEELARRLSRGGALPCGLGARDLLRLEAGFPLWGHDLDEGTTPLEAGLEWAVRFGRDFVGRPAPGTRPAGWSGADPGVLPHGGPAHPPGGLRPAGGRLAGNGDQRQFQPRAGRRDRDGVPVPSPGSRRGGGGGDPRPVGGHRAGAGGPSTDRADRSGVLVRPDRGVGLRRPALPRPGTFPSTPAGGGHGGGCPWWEG